MGDKVLVLIADDNVEFSNLLKRYIDRQEGFSVVGIARDGLETVEMIKQFAPDMVILDIIMPNLDGIGVLEKIGDSRIEKKPLFLVLSAIGQDIFIQKAILLGAQYYMVKPFDVDVLISRMRQIIDERDSGRFYMKSGNKLSDIPESNESEIERRLESAVTALLRSEDIPAHMTGYQYLREAVMQAARNPRGFMPVTKILYPEVAAKFHATPQKVERAIRNAIDASWNRNNARHTTFGSKKYRPTNSEFIFMAADKVRRQLGMK